MTGQRDTKHAEARGAPTLELSTRPWDDAYATKSVVAGYAHASAVLNAMKPKELESLRQRLGIRPEPEFAVVIAVATFGVQSWGTLLLTFPADLFPSEVVASVSGLGGFRAGVGDVLFTFLTGYLLDKFTYRPVVALTATMHAFGFVTLISLIPKVRQVRRGANSMGPT